MLLINLSRRRRRRLKLSASRLNDRMCVSKQRPSPTQRSHGFRDLSAVINKTRRKSRGANCILQDGRRCVRLHATNGCSLLAMTPDVRPVTAAVPTAHGHIRIRTDGRTDGSCVLSVPRPTVAGRSVRPLSTHSGLNRLSLCCARADKRTSGRLLRLRTDNDDSDDRCLPRGDGRTVREATSADDDQPRRRRRADQPAVCPRLTGRRDKAADSERRPSTNGRVPGGRFGRHPSELSPSCRNGTCIVAELGARRADHRRRSIGRERATAGRAARRSARSVWPPDGCSNPASTGL